jgi:hypothetical protein
MFTDVPVLDFDPQARLEIRIPIRSLLALGHLTSGPIPATVTLANASIDKEADATAVLERVAREHSVRLIDLRSNLCNSVECRYIAGNTLLFKDSDHLEPEGVRLALVGVELFPPESPSAATEKSIVH